MDAQHTEQTDPAGRGHEERGKWDDVRPMPRRLHPTFLTALDRLFQAHNGKVYDRKGRPKRDCSSATREHRLVEIRTVFLDLAELGYRLQHPKSLVTRHLERLADHWRQKGLTPQTLNRRFSMLRVFCGWMGKREMVRDLCDYYPDDPSVYKRTGIAKKNLSWEANDVDPLAEIERAKAIDERLALFLALQHHFAVRVKESIHLRPLHSSTDEHDVLEVFEGTKGGRPRLVKIETPAQREVVEWAKRLAVQNRNGTIRWPGRNWKQAQDHFYYLMKKMRITKKDRGITSHGLRHGGLQREYTQVTGTKTAIEGMDPKQVDVEAHRLACFRVAGKAGHGRTSVMTGYCGSFGYALRQPRVFMLGGIPV